MRRLAILLTLAMVAGGRSQQWVNHEHGYNWGTPKDPIALYPARYRKRADSSNWIGNKSYERHYGCVGMASSVGDSTRWYLAITSHYGLVIGHSEPADEWSLDFYTDNTPGQGRYRSSVASSQIDIETPRTTEGLALLLMTDAAPVVVPIASYGGASDAGYVFLNGQDGPRRVVVAFGNREGYPTSSQEISSVYMRPNAAGTSGVTFDYVGNLWAGSSISKTAQQQLDIHADGANYGNIGDYGYSPDSDAGAPSFELVVPLDGQSEQWHATYRGPVLFGLHYSERVDDCPGMFRTQIQAAIDTDGTYAERPIYWTEVLGDINGDGSRTDTGTSWADNDLEFLQDWITNSWPYCWALDFGKPDPADPQSSVRGADGVIDSHDEAVF